MTQSQIAAATSRKNAVPSTIRPLAAFARMAVLAGFPLCTAAAFAQSADAPEQALPSVTVSAKQEVDIGPQLRKKASSGALGSKSQLDTPFSTTVVSGEDLAERQVTKIGDVFFNDASVSDNSNANNAWASYTTVRGLQLDWRNAYKINGMPFIAYGITMPYEQLEQVELLKGASGFMYGFGNPGGTVNYVTKKPTDQFTASVDLGYRSSHVWTEHVDLGGRAGPNNMFGYRLNLTHEEGKPSNAVGINRNSVSLGLDARITRDLTWTFDGIYQDRNTWGATPSFYAGALSTTGAQLPGVVSGRGGLYSGNDAHFYSNLQVYQTGLRYNLNSDWTVSSIYSFSKQSRSRNETTLNLSNSAGDYSDFRYDGAESQQFSNWTTMVEGKFRTGPFRHELVAGLSWQKQIDRYSNNFVYTALDNGNIYAPYTGVYYSQTAFQKYRAGDTEQKAAFVSDTMHLTDKWSILGGLRVTNYEQNSYTGTGVGDTNYSKSGLITPTAAIMFKPMPSTTLYASYVESFDGGGVVATNYANAGQGLTPAKSRQYEVGAKTDQGIWTGTAALFRIERRSEFARNNGLGALPTFVQDGESVYQGLELAGSSRIGSQWEVGGSAMFLHTEYTEGDTNIGNRVAGAPNFMLTGRVAYRIPFVPGLKVGVDGKYTGPMKADAANNLNLGGYTVFNLGATYNTRVSGKELTLRAALTNLTNKRYWAFQYENYAQPADPRAISLSAKIAY